MKLPGLPFTPVFRAGVPALAALLAAATAQAREPASETAPRLPFTTGATTLAVLPDTRSYSQKYHHHFEAQTAWIAAQHEARNIRYALHLGDIVQSDAPGEWEVAARCLQMLDSKVPYLLVPGNHDYSGGGRASKLSEYFPVDTMRKWPTFGGVFEEGRLDNNYHLFRIGQQDWIALGLEFGPRKAVMAWANEVLEKHRDRRAIIVTHGYMFYDNKRYNSRLGSQRASPHGFAGDGADGEKLWNTVVHRHPNVMIVICGHVRTGGLGYSASEGDYGNTVHEMMANYQKLRGGGMAFMRLLEFLPDGKTVQVRTVSPLTGEARHSELEDFAFELRGATRDEPVPVGPGAPTPLRKPPIHRYPFNGGGGHAATLTDDAGNALGAIHAADASARLNGKGQLVLDSSDDTAGHGRIPASILSGRRTVSIELWVTPTADAYNWDPVVRFADGDDAFYYAFRTLQKHRAELINDGHNEDIQRTINVTVGEAMHILMTYDQNGPGGHPEIASFIDGEETGRMRTSIKLSDLDLAEGRIGPFAGVFDELRFYDYALSPGEVRNNFASGPDKIRVEARQPPLHRPH